MPEHVEVILRSFLAFGLLLIGARVLGKRTISQMTIFDFIASISMGAIAANLAFNTSIEAHNIVLAYCMFVMIIFFIAVFSLKSRKNRKFFAGDPTVVIQNGKILEHNMKKMRYTLDYLNQQLREKDVFDIQEVLYAILEINGTLTVLKKPQYRYVTRKDLQLPSEKEARPPIEIIMDGEVMAENLKENGLTEGWLDGELSKRGLSREGVMYAVLAPNGSLYIDTSEDHILHPFDKE
ncbi:DUF421 domain-containing protein [Metabacillus indicus]|uniref:DUF421 domain-containing protein n=1 Tax=Metabacillus indicus TaxID=246786 RepID=UPI0039843AA2